MERSPPFFRTVYPNRNHVTTHPEIKNKEAIFIKICIHRLIVLCVFFFIVIAIVLNHKFVRVNITLEYKSKDFLLNPVCMLIWDYIDFFVQLY